MEECLEDKKRELSVQKRKMIEDREGKINADSNAG